MGYTNIRDTNTHRSGVGYDPASGVHAADDVNVSRNMNAVSAIQVVGMNADSLEGVELEGRLDPSAPWTRITDSEGNALIDHTSGDTIISFTTPINYLRVVRETPIDDGSEDFVVYYQTA